MTMFGTKNVITSDAEIWASSQAGGDLNYSSLTSSFGSMWRSSTISGDVSLFARFDHQRPIRVMMLNDHNATQSATYSAHAYGFDLVNLNGAGFDASAFNAATTAGTISFDGNQITLVDWEGTLEPKTGSFDFDPSATYGVFVEYTGSTGIFEGTKSGNGLAIANPPNLKQFLPFDRVLKSGVSLSGNISRIWVKELLVSNVDKFLVGPQASWAGTPWAALPWDGHLPEDEIPYVRNTAWILDQDLPVGGIYVVFHEDPTNTDGYFQLRNLHASHAWEITGANIWPNGLDYDLGGQGDVKRGKRGMPSVSLEPNPYRELKIPTKDIPDPVFLNNLWLTAGRAGKTFPVPFIFNQAETQFDQIQKGNFYGLLSPKGHKFGEGCRWSGAFEIKEIRL